MFGTNWLHQLWRRPPWILSRRDWTNGWMWNFKPSASYPLLLQVTSYKCRPTKNYLFILVTFLRYWRLKNFFFNLKRFRADDLGFLFMGVKWKGCYFMYLRSNCYLYHLFYHYFITCSTAIKVAFDLIILYSALCPSDAWPIWFPVDRTLL